MPFTVSVLIVNKLILVADTFTSTPILQNLLFYQWVAQTKFDKFQCW